MSARSRVLHAGLIRQAVWNLFSGELILLFALEPGHSAEEAEKDLAEMAQVRRGGEHVWELQKLLECQSWEKDGRLELAAKYQTDQTNRRLAFFFGEISYEYGDISEIRFAA